MRKIRLVAVSSLFIINFSLFGTFICLFSVFLFGVFRLYFPFSFLFLHCAKGVSCRGKRLRNLDIT